MWTVVPVIILGLFVLLVPFILGARASQRSRYGGDPESEPLSEPTYQTEFKPFVAAQPRGVQDLLRDAYERERAITTDEVPRPEATQPVDPEPQDPPRRETRVRRDGLQYVFTYGHVATPAVVEEDADAYFREDPLGALSLPTRLETSVIADGVLLDILRSGALPPDRVFPVDASWHSWGYDLSETQDAAESATVADDDVTTGASLELTLELNVPELVTQGG